MCHLAAYLYTDLPHNLSSSELGRILVLIFLLLFLTENAFGIYYDFYLLFLPMNKKMVFELLFSITMLC